MHDCVPWETVAFLVGSPEEFFPLYSPLSIKKLFIYLFIYLLIDYGTGV
jgi:hypothetical protein